MATSLHLRHCDEEGRMAALRRYEVLDTAPEAPFDKITALVQSVLGVPICVVSLVDAERQWFKSSQGVDIRETSRSASFCTRTIQTDQHMLVADARVDHRFSANPLVLGQPFIQSYLGVPLRTPDGYNVGSLCVIDTVPRDYTDAQIDTLKAFASLVVDELELRRIAGRDHLTGALTRRGFITELEKAISVFDRHGRDSVLLLVDIDHFKAVNDTYGHPTGDRVIKAFATACCDQLRECDSFGRLGGEEFGILLWDTDRAGGMSTAEKIRNTVQNLVAAACDGIRVTASFGLTCLNSGFFNSENWIAEADQALYAAKRQGRNRCVASVGMQKIAAVGR